MAKLRENDVMCIEVLHEKGHSNRSIAREFNVDESTIRYRLKRLEAKAIDGRKSQPEACEPYDEVIRAWMDQQSERRPEPIKTLYELLVTRYGYSRHFRPQARLERAGPGPVVCRLRQGNAGGNQESRH